MFALQLELSAIFGITLHISGSTRPQDHLELSARSHLTSILNSTYFLNARYVTPCGLRNALRQLVFCAPTSSAFARFHCFQPKKEVWEFTTVSAACLNIQPLTMRQTWWQHCDSQIGITPSQKLVKGAIGTRSSFLPSPLHTFCIVILSP